MLYVVAYEYKDGILMEQIDACDWREAICKHSKSPFVLAKESIKPKDEKPMLPMATGQASKESSIKTLCPENIEDLTKACREKDCIMAVLEMSDLYNHIIDLRGAISRRG